MNFSASDVCVYKTLFVRIKSLIYITDVHIRTQQYIYTAFVPWQSRFVCVQGRIQSGGSGGCNPLFSSRRGSIISYNFIRKRKLVMLQITANGEPPLSKIPRSGAGVR